MKLKPTVTILIVFLLLLGCSNSINYSEEFKTKTAGVYLFNADDVITISYDKNTLLFDWRGVTTKPVITDTNEFFVPDLYKKMRFVKHPDTNERYLSVISEDNPDSISYDYLKAPKGYKTPSQHLENKNYDLALEGYLKIKAQDSTSDFISQYKFNRLGYKFIREDNFKDAIGVFTMNTKLHPNIPNVYDSLGQAYLVSGDSLQAYENYKKAFELNRGNKRAKRYIDAYENK